MTHRDELARKTRRARDVQLMLSVVVIALVLGAAGLYFLLQPRPAGCGTRVGELACSFTVEPANGHPTFTLAEAKAPVLIDFMGSNCSSCELEMPHLKQTYDSFAARGLKMISLDVGGPLGTEDPQEAAAFMARYGGAWAIALDNQGIAVNFSAFSLPTIYILDSDGVIKYKHGFATAQALAQEIEAVL